VSKPTPAANDDARETPAAGKGRPTPTRAEREAANRRPLVANTKEARAAAKADLQARRERARIGMERGEDKYLPARDKGPQRRWVRDYVDAGWHISEWLMAAMLAVILLNLTPIPSVQLWAMVGLWVYVLLAVMDMVLLSMRVKRKAAAKFGKDKLEKGLGWYAAMRALQMRFMRLPKPQAKRGQYPD
jgi:Flp pilus assembly protein TadB